MNSLVTCGVIALAACTPATTVSGSATLNVQPVRPPSFAGQYDFDLLDSVRGKACIKRASAFGTNVTYWVGSLPFARSLPKDSLTVGAIAAASIDAIDNISEADTILILRVVTEGKSPDEVCASVHGRAVRLKKAVPATMQPEPDSDKPDEDDTDEKLPDE